MASGVRQQNAVSERSVIRAVLSATNQQGINQTVAEQEWGGNCDMVLHDNDTNDPWLHHQLHVWIGE